MELAMSIATAGYLIFISVLIIGWKRLNAYTAQGGEESMPKVSIVLVVRNEAQNISSILEDLLKQSVPAEYFEIIVVDDHSEDGTWQILSEWQKTHPNLRILPMESVAGYTSSPKKAGITHAVNIAKGEVILVTDGDCHVGNEWALQMALPFRSPKIHFVSGPVVIQGGKNLWPAWQKLEFASLIGTGAALIGLNRPVMCNGANMAFRRSAFIDAGGYDGNFDAVSGDDVFLMQKIHRMFGGVVFLKNTSALVSTSPEPDWKSFARQRIRWAGKWARYQNLYALLLPMGIFAFYAIFLISCVFATVGYFNAWILLLVAASKILIDYQFLAKVYAFYGEKLNIGLLVISSLSYSVYAMIFGIASNFTGYRWKGRNYKKYKK